MKRRHAVVTGGAVFIGFSPGGALTKRNEVIVIEDLSNRHLDNIHDFICDQVKTSV